MNWVSRSRLTLPDGKVMACEMEWEPGGDGDFLGFGRLVRRTYYLDGVVVSLEGLQHVVGRSVQAGGGL